MDDRKEALYDPEEAAGRIHRKVTNALLKGLDSTYVLTPEGGFVIDPKTGKPLEETPSVAWVRAGVAFLRDNGITVATADKEASKEAYASKLRTHMEELRIGMDADNDDDNGAAMAALETW
uniref:Uncharacterized protein n=1 Tax=Candidatus Kentrum sp. TC TaxID=2126339 RepID=A0A451A9M8_9GAMM|nr:MAG: hypothetical protein BECKTC1821F_GA0114240_10796 [Candidatus Kentron sp. TC]